MSYFTFIYGTVCKLRDDSADALRKLYVKPDTDLNKSEKAGLIALETRILTDAGAAALSVLAEPHQFLGDEENVRIARSNTDLPILFKDFVSTSYQILRARACGADAVLLIAAVLDDARLAKLLAVTRHLGMEALVETHTAAEIERAVKANAKIIGVNCRDLKTFHTDPSITAELIGKIPAGIVKIAESGVRSADDLRALQAAGADGVLIGETLMRAEHPGNKLKELTK